MLLVSRFRFTDLLTSLNPNVGLVDRQMNIYRIGGILPPTGGGCRRWTSRGFKKLPLNNSLVLCSTLVETKQS